MMGKPVKRTRLSNEFEDLGENEAQVSRKHNNTSHSLTENKLSANAYKLTSLIRGYVHVPYRWSRCLTEDFENDGQLVYYCSPSGLSIFLKAFYNFLAYSLFTYFLLFISGRVLFSFEEVTAYMAEKNNNCCCYFVDALKLEDSFNFDPAISGLALPPPKRIKSIRTGCIKHYDEVGPGKFESMITKMKQEIEKMTVNVATEKDVIKVFLREYIDDSKKVSDLLNNFDWYKVNVLTNGRVYLRQPTKVQWQHCLYEWKNNSSFSRTKSLRPKSKNADEADEQINENVANNSKKLQELASLKTGKRVR